MKNGFYWIAYDGPPFNEFIIFSKKPVLKNDDRFSPYFESDGGDTAVLNTKLIRMFITREEFNYLMENRECIQVFIGGEIENSVFPESEQDKKMFISGINYIINDL